MEKRASEHLSERLLRLFPDERDHFVAGNQLGVSFRNDDFVPPEN